MFLRTSEELQNLLQMHAYHTSTDGSTVSANVLLYTFTQLSFEKLQGLLSLFAFLKSADGSIVSDSVCRLKLSLYILPKSSKACGHCLPSSQALMAIL